MGKDSTVDSRPAASGAQASAGSPVKEGMSPAETLLAIYKQLCDWRAFSAGKVKKLSAERRDELAKMYAPLIEVKPPAPLVGERPGGKLTKGNVNCNLPNLRSAGILTGKLRPEGPRMLVDLFTGMGGGAELELLELRLHELDGVADIVVVTESSFGNRCDQKELHFQRQKERFAQFLPKILHVVTDRCPDYMKK